MRQLIFRALTVAGIVAAYAATMNADTCQSVSLSTQGMDISVQFVTPEIVRVTKTPAGQTNDSHSLVVIKEPEVVEAVRENNHGVISISSDSLTVRINEKTGGITFLSPSGETLLLDKDYGTSFAFDNAVNNDTTHKVRSSFLLAEDEPIYGIGQVMDGKFNRRAFYPSFADGLHFRQECV